MSEKELWNILTAFELYCENLRRWKDWDDAHPGDFGPPWGFEHGGRSPYLKDGSVDSVLALEILLHEDSYKGYLESFPSEEGYMWTDPPTPMEVN